MSFAGSEGLMTMKPWFRRCSIDIVFLLYIIFLLLPLVSCQNKTSIFLHSDSLTLSKNQTLISSGNVFELGFFSPVPSNNQWYIGIWYMDMPERTYVWVANRDNPVNSSDGILQFEGSNLVIRDQSKSMILKTKTQDDPAGVVVAELLDNGNFVVRYSNNRNAKDFLWESFNFPADTLLPEMKLRWDSQKVRPNKFLTSWRTAQDPGEGDKFFGFEANGFPALSSWMIDETLYRSGPWNGIKFIGAPAVFHLTWNRDQTPLLSIESFSRLQLDHSGAAILHTWNQSTKMWDMPWISVHDHCDLYRLCPPNAYCNPNMPWTKECTCIQGFELRDSKCVRKLPLQCDGDIFSKLANMNIPYISKANRYDLISRVKECQEMCVKDCGCTGFSLTYILENGKKKNKSGLVIGLSVGSLAVAIFALGLFCVWKRKQKRAARTTTSSMAMELEVATETNVTESHNLSRMDFGLVLKATENFSHEIGSGGFGKVYKGRLSDGQEMAVKKLSSVSRQGTSEFYTEVKLIRALQHINIVRLLGWSVYKDEKVLIYEYLENGSLERHLFGESSGELSWQVRFDIIKGIAQGLAYMEEGSRDMIIHRDLKPANILLDRDMTPKISDFGLARICQRSVNEASSTKAAGTHGYMSPECSMDGIYSKRSDIFSFGVMVLEVISGKQNRRFSYNTNLLSHVWTKWKEGNWEDTVDHVIRDSSPFLRQQIKRCVEIGLLCVQQLPNDRPDMSSVVMMLVSEGWEIPEPNRPGFFMDDSQNPSSSSTSATSTINQYTNSVILAR